MPDKVSTRTETWSDMVFFLIIAGLTLTWGEDVVYRRSSFNIKDQILSFIAVKINQIVSV